MVLNHRLAREQPTSLKGCKIVIQDLRAEIAKTETFTHIKIRSLMLNPQAAVAFDGTAMKYTVISDKKLLEGAGEGTTLDHNGSDLTVLQFCSTLEEAKAACEQRMAQQNDTKAHADCGLARIVFDAKGDAMSEYSVEHSDTSSPTEPAVDECKENGDAPDEVNMESFREVLMNIIRETDLDITRLKNRKDMFQQLYVQYFGTGPDGSITDDGEDHSRALTRKLGSKFLRRISSRIAKSNELFSHFDRMAENRKRRGAYSDNEGERRVTKRSRYDDDEDWTEEGNLHGSTGHVGRAGKVLNYPYPYVPQEEEHRILLQSNGSASAYAQSLAKLLFADTLDLYFKDQDQSKRQWIHEAVDFRFPSHDRNAQLLKWKNCSQAINKNMRKSERPLAPENDKAKRKQVECTYVNADYEAECYRKAGKDPTKYAELLSLKLFEGSWDKYFKEQDPKMKDWLRECVDRRYYINDKSKRDARWKVCAAACNRNRTKIVGKDGKEEEYPYVSKEAEENCFQEANGVPYVYAEAMAKLLFPDTPHLFFKDQDLGKRNWLHDVLDRRFPTPDKLHQVSKWKSCTTAINRNKTDKPPAAPATAANPKQTSQAAVTETKSTKKGQSNSAKSAEKKEQPKEKDAKKRKEHEKDKQEKHEEQSTSKAHTSRKPTDKGKEESSKSHAKEDNKGHAKEDKGHAKEDPPKRERESSRISSRAKIRPEPYTSYPFVTEEEEIQIYEASKRDVEAYAKNLARILFKDSIKLLFKDQDEDRRSWLQGIVDFRFPTYAVIETRSKWAHAIKAINKNATGH
ncbi:unnamed protein product [Cylicocyclus nassatus]|uniref:Uncharacterized protein n=1 Tax=Cylicocyclus nassatus TaxID=53992 RepID=A0AA36H468_CYLNA|nr:unnamed protein product [Cylicocyclus nassatus]